MPQTKIKRVIAGPGAGKTSGLVDEVLAVLPTIKPNRFLVVITYTNAATEKIRLRLEKSIKIPPNVFIGTIHAFLDRFILIPHASRLKIVPNEISFIDDIEANPTYKRAAIKRARDKGIITYEQIEWISEKIICGGKIEVETSEVNITLRIARAHANTISKRLQCVFVDEYQDASIAQHNIFTQLINTNLIDYFYCVGDPEQYIYGFTYQGSTRKPGFKDIPIYKLENIAGLESTILNENRRSQPKIIKFINQFASLKQANPEPITAEQPNIIFLKNINKEELIDAFLSICENNHLSDKTKFVLSYARNTASSSQLADIAQYLDPAVNSERLLSETLRYISSILGYSQKEICRLKDWDKVGLRKMAFKVLRKIKSDENISELDVIRFLEQEFEINVNAHSGYKSRASASLEKIKLALSNVTTDRLNVHSTIHKSKGLEAHAVLVIAKTKTELTKWLEQDSEIRSGDVSDSCRLGFVAFSRARELLCLACLEDVSSIHARMQSLGIVLESTSEAVS